MGMRAFDGRILVGLTMAMLGTACAVEAGPGSAPAPQPASLALHESSAATFDASYLAGNGDSLRLTVRFTPTTTFYEVTSSNEGVLLLEGTEHVARPDSFAPGFNGDYAPLAKGTALYDALRDVQDRLRDLGVSERPDDSMKGKPVYGAGWMTAQLLSDIPDFDLAPEVVASPERLQLWLSQHSGDLSARVWPVPETTEIPQVEEPTQTMSYQPGNYGSCGGIFALDYCCGPLNCRDGKKTNQGPCALFGYCPYNCGTECSAGDLCFWMFGSKAASTHYTINGQSLPLCGTPYSLGQSWYGGSCPHSDAYVFVSNGSAQGFLNNNMQYAASTKCCNSDPGCMKP